MQDESRALFFGGLYRLLFSSNFSNSSSVKLFCFLFSLVSKTAAETAREYDSCAHRRCWTAAASCPYYSCRRRYKPVGLVLPSVYCSRTRCCAIRFVDDESRALFFGGWYRSLFSSNFSNSSSVIANYIIQNLVPVAVFPNYSSLYLVLFLCFLALSCAIFAAFNRHRCFK